MARRLPSRQPHPADALRPEIQKYRGRDSNPHGLTANGFSYHYGFRRPPAMAVCGLDYTFTFYYASGVTVRREPSSLYTFLEAV